MPERQPDKQDVLAGLRHRAVSSRANQDRAVHLSGARDHVLDVVGVAGAVNVSVVTVRRFVLNVRRADGDTTCFFFRGVVDLRVIASFAAVCLGQNRADCSGQSGFTVVNVTDSTDVDVWFSPFKLTFCHDLSQLCFTGKQKNC